MMSSLIRFKNKMSKFLNYLDKDQGDYKDENSSSKPLPSELYLKIFIDENKERTLYITLEDVEKLKDLFGLSVEELSEIFHEVDTSCRKIGLRYELPQHALLSLEHSDCPQACMKVNYLTPPMFLQDDRPIVPLLSLYIPSILEEMDRISEGVKQIQEYLTAMNLGDQAKSVSDQATLLRGWIRTVIGHEFVHLCATEARGKIMSLGLEQLELLTDAINIVTFYEINRSETEPYRLGTYFGSGYIANKIAILAMTDNDFRHILERQLELAHQIIHESKVTLGLTSPG